MSPLLIVAIAVPVLVVLMFIGGYLGWHYSDAQKTLRLIRDVPQVRIADAVEGELVKVVGRLELRGEGLVSPVMETACTYYDTNVLIRKLIQRGIRSDSTYVTVWRDVDSRDFYVTDETGRAVVQTLQTKVSLTREAELSIGAMNDSVELRVFAEERGFLEKDELGMEIPMRCVEGVLEPGREVVVVGEARWIDAPQNAAGEGEPTGTTRLLGIDAPVGGTVYISDEPILACPRSSGRD